MKLKNTLNEADNARGKLRSPYYKASDGISLLRAAVVSNFNKDKKFVSLVQKADTALDNVYKYMEKNYKGWD